MTDLYFKFQSQYMACLEKCLKKRNRSTCQRECEEDMACLICHSRAKR